ncbi:hypothetical protein HZC20_01630 [Candidatus Peregrinibacteria bacterium]|nr:hypothetical protein [Candidatus Peregrinibacteria bacterium]
MNFRSVDDLVKQKRRAKVELAKKFGFYNEFARLKAGSRYLSSSPSGRLNDKILLGIFLDKALSKPEEEKLKIILDGLNAIDVQVVALADSNMHLFEGVAGAFVLHYTRLNRHKLLMAADIALSFDFSDIEELMINGVIPISSKRPEVFDYDPNRETGNGFIYKNDSPWGIFAALVRALETFKFPYDWKHIMRQGSDFTGGFEDRKNPFEQ